MLPEQVKYEEMSISQQMAAEELMAQATLYDMMSMGYDPMAFPEMMIPPMAHQLSPYPASLTIPPFQEPFSPEFYEYKGESIKSSNKRKPKAELNPSSDNLTPNNTKDQELNVEGENGEKESMDTESEDINKMDSAELRRQIHIQSEQKRRAQIKGGFEELRRMLPNCSSKQLSKAAILNKTCLHLQHLKGTQIALLSEIDRLRIENEHLRHMNLSLYPKQAINSVYSLGL